MPHGTLRLRTRTWPLGQRTYVMGVLNVTPDSFSDGEAYLERDDAVARALQMVEEGADIIDVGGESTRPGSQCVGEDEELRRVIPVIEAIVSRSRVPVSIDTRKSAVARRAVEAGAELINDVSAFGHDPNMSVVAAELQVPVVLMHMRATPATMQQMATYEDVVAESAAELRGRVSAARAAGIPDDRIVVDPGFGFAKTAEHNLELLDRLDEWHRLVDPGAPHPGREGDAGLPLLVGTSRKSFIGKVLGGAGPLDRLEGTAATVALAIARGADIVRVHDVAFMRRVAAMCDAVVRRAATERSTGPVIELFGLTFSARHGVHPGEKVKAQPFAVDVRLQLAGAPRRDHLDATVDYGQVYAWVKEAVEGPSVNLLETLASRILARIRQGVAPRRLIDLEVRVHKPDAPLPGAAQDVVVTVRG